MDVRRVNAGLLAAAGALWLLTLVDDVGPDTGLVTWVLVLTGVGMLLPGLVAMVRPTTIYDDRASPVLSGLLALFCLTLLVVVLLA